MIDIVKHIKNHTESLHKGFKNLSAEQAKQLKLMALVFYFKLPRWQMVIEQYIKSPIDKEKLIDDIIKESTTSYQEIMKKSTAEVDEYADDYEELEQIPIFILDAFDNAIADNKNKESVVALFLGIIDTLDHYENFSEEPVYWNQILEEEVAFQSELLMQLQSKIQPDISVYEDRYKMVEFPDLEV
jgi:hypothetical protein